MPRGSSIRSALMPILLLYLLPACTNKLAPRGPGPLYNATGRLDRDGDVLQLVGGANASGSKSAAWALDIPHREWVRIDGPSDSLLSAASVRLDDTVWVFGGTSGDGRETANLVEWPTLAGAWTPSPTSGERPPPRREAAWVAVSDTQAVLVGGSTDDEGEPGSIFGDVWGFDADRASFTPVDTVGGPTGLQRHAMASDGERLWVHGGVDETGALTANLWSLELTTWTWTLHEPASDAPSARSDHFLAWWDSKLVLWGGATEDTQIWTWQPTTSTWTATASDGPVARDAFVADTVQGEPWAIVVGGDAADDSAYLSDVWALDLDALEWTELTQLDGQPF